MSHHHAVVWLDQHAAKAFHVTETEAERITVTGRAPDRHISTHGSRSREHQHADDGFLHEVVEAMSGAQGRLITGPGDTKQELVRHIDRHHPQYRRRIVGVDRADHPSDGHVCAHARRVFAKVDRTLPQR
ncbi:hypothetical protein [Elioraea sp.]|jgi:stalled ribosome rescue protein Dom34|uniref:hypothetical protein n=1 Tax=Elioraea sp. TaxID=2185103 RepID=UPI003F721E99